MLDICHASYLHHMHLHLYVNLQFHQVCVCGRGGGGGGCKGDMTRLDGLEWGQADLEWGQGRSGARTWRHDWRGRGARGGG